MIKYVDFSELVGETIVEVTGLREGNDSILFHTQSGKQFVMEHQQDCCERVYIEDVVGDVEDILNSPILRAEESTNRDDPPANDWNESYTWTFYRLRTIKGSLIIRWYGSSNGYYSESVGFIRTK